MCCLLPKDDDFIRVDKVRKRVHSEMNPTRYEPLTEMLEILYLVCSEDTLR